ncbi:Uncharacterised protein [Zhongshania aliphaticivorans]|uniref:Uncharacterized protein n=1 Tax=Zhongshania aliphaticivorans TaxID=1470434 RepID=A0A5S9N142_9GAMM|nr:hypothetical protein [Zhongshania aliphaticivorans]CAA0083219.1 Uncharacterised protein [Zhongshania aliphaticivorans]CAA0083556.1 Uncharacterised protein [Zhongshania aliphaticivorans]
MKGFNAIWLLVLLTSVSYLQADDLGESYNVMCSKMKSCALQSIGEANLSPAMRDMVMTQLEGACVSVQQQFGNVADTHPLYGAASKCLSSMAKLSCDEIENMNDEPTPACASYEKMAASYP